MTNSEKTRIKKSSSAIHGWEWERGQGGSESIPVALHDGDKPSAPVWPTDFLFPLNLPRVWLDGEKNALSTGVDID